MISYQVLQGDCYEVLRKLSVNPEVLENIGLSLLLHHIIGTDITVRIQKKLAKNTLMARLLKN